MCAHNSKTAKTGSAKKSPLASRVIHFRKNQRNTMGFLTSNCLVCTVLATVQHEHSVQARSQLLQVMNWPTLQHVYTDIHLKSM